MIKQVMYINRTFFKKNIFECFSLFIPIFIGGVILFAVGIFFIPLNNDTTLYAMVIEGYTTGCEHYPKYMLPQLFPLLGYVISLFGFSAHTSGYIVGSFFYVVTVFPLYFFLKLFYNRSLSSIGCILYITCPIVISYCCMGLLESIRNFFLIFSLFYLFSFFLKKNIYKLFLLGVCLGGLSLSKNEGLFFAFSIILIYLILSVLRNEYKGILRFLIINILYILLIFITFLPIISTRLVNVYNITGCYGLTITQAKYTAHFLDIPFDSKKYINTARTKKIKIITSNVTKKNKKKLSKPKNSNKQTSNFYGKRSCKLEFLKQKIKYLYKFINCFFMGTSRLYLFFAVFGLVLLFIYRKVCFHHVILLFLVIFNIILNYPHPTLVSNRRFIINVLFLMPFILEGGCFYYYKTKKLQLNRIFNTIIIILIIFQILIGLMALQKKSNYYLKNLGGFIRENNLFSDSLNPNSSIWINGRYPQIAYWSRVNYVVGFPDRIMNRYEPSSKLELEPELVYLRKKELNKKTLNYINFLLSEDMISKINTPWENEALIFKINGQ